MTGRSVLVVDDAASMRTLVASTLADQGMQVAEAGDGAAALDLFDRSGPFDLVVTDLNMPRMDGLELIRSLRTRAACRFTPILMLTTEAKPEMKQAGRQAGATGWLVKPFDPGALVGVVRKVLR